MEHTSILHEFLHNVSHNLFKPLLLFFYLGFLVPILRVPFEFPKVIYQGLTIYLLVSIGWKGGEELASLEIHELKQAFGFMVIGFITNFCIGILAYLILRAFSNLRRVDAATVAAYYGSDSAGTFVTCVGVLGALVIQFGQDALREAGNLPIYEDYAPAKYMSVMLAVMEIPGCLVGLALVSRMRRQGMDRWGNMPDEEGYMKKPAVVPVVEHHDHGDEHGDSHDSHGAAAATAMRVQGSVAHSTAVAKAEELALTADSPAPATKHSSIFSAKVMHEVFLNPGLYLLFGGIFIGFVSRLQGLDVVKEDDRLFKDLFTPILCLFLLEMGMTACQRLRDLRTAGPAFIAFGLIAPNIFATAGILIAHAYSHFLGEPFSLGTYPLFAVLCAAASYIAVPAIQRIAIPEASPTLPLAASLGLTFSYNVTIGIPIYIGIAKVVIHAWPVVAAAHGA